MSKRVLFKCPNGTTFETKNELLVLDELNALLARAKKAEAERDELKRKLSIEEVEPTRPKPSRLQIATDFYSAAIGAGLIELSSDPDMILADVLSHVDALIAELQREVAK